jgi:hypothetical protein
LTTWNAFDLRHVRIFWIHRLVTSNFYESLISISEFARESYQNIFDGHKFSDNDVILDDTYMFG